MKENSPTPNNNPAKTPWFFPFEKGRFPTLKKRKPGVYVFFALFLLFGAVILGESAVPANASGSQSNTFSSILAAFVNWFNPPSIGKVIEPTAIKLAEDTTLLPPDADMTPQFALGTTSRLTYVLTYPEKSDAKDSFDENFAVSCLNGEEGTDFTINRSIDKTNQKIYLRINAKNISSSPYQITLTAGSSLTTTYSFHVIDLPAPTSYTIATPTVSTLKVGTSYPLAITLTDPRSGISESEKKSDHDLRRYFNPTRLKPTLKGDDGVLSVDEYGVVRALKEGQATITYPGHTEFSFTVRGKASTMPTGLSLSGSGTTNLTDYDFYTPNASGEDGYEDYSMALSASFTGTTPDDQGVTFASLEPLTAKIIPYSYDAKSGVASYHNEAGAPACRVQGYRNEGEARIMAISNANGNVNTTITLNVHGAKAMTMYPSVVDETAMNTNNQLFVSATFAPKNTANGAITLSLNKEGIVSISNNGTNTVTLTALSQGSCVVTITSVSNSSLTSKVILTVTDPGLINDTNFNSFAAFTRKAAGHFALFLMTAIIGAIFFNLFFADPHSDYFALIVSCFWGFLLAGSSEMIQFLGDLWWHSGRTGAWLDVGTDTLGYIIGALLSWGVILFIRWIKKKRLLKKEQSVSEKTPVAK